MLVYLDYAYLIIIYKYMHIGPNVYFKWFARVILVVVLYRCRSMLTVRNV